MQSILINPPVCVSLGVSVCLSVREHISGTARPILTKFCVQISCGHGSVLLRRHCATLCILQVLWMTLRVAVMGAPPERIGSTQRRRSITCATGAESDVYECLFILYCVRRTVFSCIILYVDAIWSYEHKTELKAYLFIYTHSRPF